MKLPYPIHPARVPYDQRDLIPVRFSHVLAAVLVLPVVAVVAYVAATLFFQIP